MTLGNSRVGSFTYCAFLAGLLTSTFKSNLVLFRVGCCVNPTADIGIPRELCADAEAKLVKGQ